MGYLMSINFNDGLRRHLGFLERSCKSYDEGFEDEALRIAVVLRVLMHDTKNSVSLLKHLKADDVSILSSVSQIHPNAVCASGGLSCLEFTVGGAANAKYFPMLDEKKDTFEFVNWKEWWGQVVYVLPMGMVSRRQIILGAADKEGAHVDSKLDPEYEAIQKGLITITSINKESGMSFAVPDSHLSDLRQMGCEVLNSPSLLDLMRAPDGIKQN